MAPSYYYDLKTDLDSYMSKPQQDHDWKRMYHCLSQVPSEDIFQLLATKKNWQGASVLHCASMNNHHEALQQMLGTVAPENRLILLQKQDWMGQTPLHCAVEGNHTKSVACILKSLLPEHQPVLLHMQDTTRHTALDIALQEDFQQIIDVINLYTLSDRPTDSSPQAGMGHSLQFRNGYPMTLLLLVLVTHRASECHGLHT